MRQKKLSVLAMTAVAAFTLSACSSSGDDGSSDGDGASTDKLTVGIKFDQPGLGLQKGSEYSGFDVDVAYYVADKLGYSQDQVEFVQSVTAQRETMLENGQADMIVATYTMSDARKEQIDFAGPYLVAGQSLLVAADDDSISGPDNLDGKKLCSVSGAVPAQRIKDEYASDVQLYEASTYSECVELLGNGTIDAVTTDDSILAGYAAVPEYEGKFKLVGEAFSEEPYGVGFPKGSDMCEPANEALTEMIDDGSWDQFLQDNLGDAYTPDASLNPPEVGGSCS
ncbi:MAG: glutamate ABC transporter substrate-binding protein [Ancrocorticia sp.]|nr:glutamate ABC transporter substrate-binding protein [Ancrocorticia sp.]